MLEFLTNIFTSDNSKKFTYYKLYSNLRRWQDAGVYPAEYELPDAITFPSDFWKQTIQLYKYTRSDGLERAISVFWADGDLIVSSIVKGNEKSVTPKNNVSVKYSQHPTKREYARKEVFVDNKRYSRRDVYYKKIPKQVEVKYLFNMHTHPPHKLSDGKTYYSFFSAQDIKSLVKSNAVITGMIGDKLWLLFRTNSTPSNVEHLTDKDVTVQHLTQTLNIAIYSGEFKKKLTRVQPALQ